MNSFDLKFAKFIQEYAPVSLAEAEQRFERTESTLKRSIHEINDYLPHQYRIRVDKRYITSRLSYSGYRKLLQGIGVKDYITTPSERVHALVAAFALHDIVNKTEFYGSFNVSKSTLKNDRGAIADFLSDYGLTLKSVPRKGTQIEGSETRFRVLASRLIMKVVEVDPNNNLVSHKGNSPVKRLYARDFLFGCQEEIARAVELFNGFLGKYDMMPSYNHKKFFLVYLSLALKRQKSGNVLSLSEVDDFIEPPSLELLENEVENHFTSLLLTSFVYHHPVVRINDPELRKTALLICDKLIQELDLTLYNQHDFFEEVYSFLYSALVSVSVSILF